VTRGCETGPAQPEVDTTPCQAVRCRAAIFAAHDVSVRRQFSVARPDCADERHIAAKHYLSQQNIIYCAENTFFYRGRQHNTKSLLNTPLEPFMLEDVINPCDWLWHTGALLQQMAGRSTLDTWNKHRRQNVASHTIPTLLPNVEDRSINIYDIFRLLPPTVGKMQPGLLFRTYYPWMQCNISDEH